MNTENPFTDPDYSQEQELKELHSIVENLKREAEEKDKQLEIKFKQVDILANEVDRLEKEIERLKGLIDVAWDCGYDESSFAHSSDLQANYDKPIDKEQFKIDNQL